MPVYLGLGDKEKTLDWLEECYEERALFVTSRAPRDPAANAVAERIASGYRSRPRLCRCPTGCNFEFRIPNSETNSNDQSREMIKTGAGQDPRENEGLTVVLSALRVAWASCP
jgi:hypothetical protein